MCSRLVMGVVGGVAKGGGGGASVLVPSYLTIYCNVHLQLLQSKVHSVNKHKATLIGINLPTLSHLCLMFDTFKPSKTMALA